MYKFLFIILLFVTSLILIFLLTSEIARETGERRGETRKIVKKKIIVVHSIMLFFVSIEIEM